VLEPGASGQSAYIEASIQCVQSADNRRLEKIILHGLRRMQGNP